MKKIASFFLIFILGFSFADSSPEVFDVETLPAYRTKQYSSYPYDHIVVFSAPRTGSSLVYNILRFLFEDDAKLNAIHTDFNLDRRILKTHLFTDLDLVETRSVLYVYTCRDPIAASISNFRIAMRKINSFQAFAYDLAQRNIRYLDFSEKLEASGKQVFRLFYEDFTENMDDLFDKLEAYFHIFIDSRDKELMKKGYSKSSILANVENFDSFKDYLPISGFHGQHVNVNHFAPPQELLYWLDVYLEDAKPLFRKYGYFSDLN